MSKSSRAFLALAALAGLIVYAPLTLSYERFIPDLQTRLGQLTHSKVTIGKISFGYLPRPAFTLEQIRIGPPEPATIGRITVPVSFSTLVSMGRDIDEVQAENITVSPRLALSLSGRLTPVSDGQTRIRKAMLINASVALKQESLGPMDALLEFKPDGTIDRLTIQTKDNNAVLQIQPANTPGAFDVLFSAKDWKPPLANPVKFDAILLTGKATADSLQVSEARASLYDGALSGNARLEWRQRLILTGQITARGLKAEPLIGLFSPDTRASGQLAGDGAFRFESTRFQQLFDAPQLQGRFILSEGAIHNLDLVSPLKSAEPGQKRQGGQTSFNLLSGNIDIQGQDVVLRGLKLESGKFRAQGEARIRNGKLSGGATTTLASDNILAGNNVTFSGTLAAPELQSGGTWRPAPAASPEVR